MKEQKDIFTHLKKTDKSIPEESYFKNLASEIIANESAGTKVIPIYKKPAFWLISAAASITLLVVLNLPSPKSETTLISFNDVTQAEIEGYVTHYISDFDTDLITEFISEENIVIPSINTEEKDTESNESTVKTIDLDHINEDEILDYFESEEIDIYNENLELDYEELYI